MFNEENTVENLIRDMLSDELNWVFVSRENIQRKENEVLVENLLKSSLQKLNPSIKEHFDRIDEIIYKLNTIIFSVHDVGLIKANEEFSKWLKNEQSMPYGKNGEHIQIKLIDFENINYN